MRVVYTKRQETTEQEILDAFKAVKNYKISFEGGLLVLPVVLYVCEGKFLTLKKLLKRRYIASNSLDEGEILQACEESFVVAEGGDLDVIVVYGAKHSRLVRRFFKTRREVLPDA